MPIEPVKIPQNVQIEDRLIGPITLRQVILCLIGAGISFAIWNIMQKSGMGNFLGIIISLVPLSIAAAFAFVQVQGLSLVRIILLIVEKNKKPAVRKCGPRAGIQINVKTYFSSQGSAVVRNTAAPETDKLSQLSTLLDEGTDTAHTKLETTETPSAKVEPNVPVDKSRVSVDQTQPEVVAPSVDGIEKPADPPTPIS